MMRPQRSLHHAGQHLLCGQERAGEVDGEDEIPVLFLHAHRQAVFGDAGVVHQDVDRPASLSAAATASLMESCEVRSR